MGLEMDKRALEELVRKVLLEKMNGREPRVFGVRSVPVPRMQVTEADRMNTGNPGDRVYTKDFFSLSESPRMGAGLMVMEKTTFPWTLNYDEMDYVIDGHLDVRMNGGVASAGPGEVIYIPKGSAIEFSAPDHARFLYFVYPADWQNQQ